MLAFKWYPDNILAKPWNWCYIDSQPTTGYQHTIRVLFAGSYLSSPEIWIMSAGRFTRVRLNFFFSTMSRSAGAVSRSKSSAARDRLRLLLLLHARPHQLQRPRVQKTPLQPHRVRCRTRPLRHRGSPQRLKATNSDRIGMNGGLPCPPQKKSSARTSR